MSAAGKGGGYSLVEVLVALSVFSLVALSISSGVATGVRAGTMSAHFTLATILAQDKLEELRAQFEPVSSGSDTPQPGFSRAWDITPDSPQVGVVQIEVTVSWTDYQPHMISLATVVNE